MYYVFSSIFLLQYFPWQRSLNGSPHGLSTSPDLTERGIIFINLSHSHLLLVSLILGYFEGHQRYLGIIHERTLGPYVVPEIKTQFSGIKASNLPIILCFWPPSISFLIGLPWSMWEYKEQSHWFRIRSGLLANKFSGIQRFRTPT